ncbi:n-acetylglucosaminyl transferase component [Ophiostoma piceae UAMH 11346]|uniref:N-acetylglucosaminyl transferase component n=1 Tax=Ophiostoma piceae (strain UAMH 11346) TaxID=1262450 RepID=S3BSD0_OPHP1|nr:n-acetylglucosaminyl transferase component [Ophiostoma piceae UAMH 11346]
MPEHDGLMRVFWPVDIARSEVPGVVVGWKNSALDVTVVAILEDVDVRSVDFALKAGTLFRNSTHSITRIYELCGQSNMHVLGLSNMPDGQEPLSQAQTQAQAQATTQNQFTDLSWVRVVTTGPGVRGRIPKVTCARASNIQLILYQRPQPHRMQYISIHPVSLALKDRLNSGSGSPDAISARHSSGRRTDKSGRVSKPSARAPAVDTGSDAFPADDIEAEDERHERLRKEKTQNLLNKLRLHSVVRRTLSSKERALPKIVNQINWAWELETLLQKNVSRIIVGTRSKRSLSMSERVVESATTMKDIVLRWIWDLIMLYVVPVITRIFVLGLIGHRIAAEMLLRVLEWRANPRHAALKDISATAQQVEIRLLQFCYWPMQYVKLRQRSNDWESVTTSHPDYIRFYNSLWLVANDVIIGIALGSYIIDNANWVADQISTLLSEYTVDALQSSISWLMGWPAGLKLNGELAAFLGDLFLWVIEYWAGCIEALRPALPHIICHPSTSVIFLTPIPLSFKAMFHQYFQMGSRIRKHYLAPRVLLCLLTGKFVPPINRKNLYSLQYVMLPARRAGIWEMWEALKSLPPLAKTRRMAFPDIGGGGPGGAGGRRMRGQSFSGGLNVDNRRARR